MSDIRVVVVGDVMLDNYWFGSVDRISPEAPVPIVAIEKRESRLGGAANVALNCRALGAHVTLASIIGNDENGKALLALAGEGGIDTSLVMKSNHRPTTTKVRILSKGQQMMRIDEEVTHDLNTAEEHPFIDTVLQYLQKVKPHAVIFEDYNKGVLKENVIHQITEHCKTIGIITVVDPKKKNFLSYKDVTIFKPNLKEVHEGLHFDMPSIDRPQLNIAHQKLKEHLNHSITFITLSEKGVYFNDGENADILPSHIRDVADVSGAGDTVVATATLIFSITRDVRLMAAIANLAGGLVCGEAGVVAINKSKLLTESTSILCE